MTDTRRQHEPLVTPGGIELFERDMTVVADADVRLAVLQSRLAEAGQWLPIDGDPAWTVGELVESNSTGPLRLGYGGWRDLLLGVQYENGRGELITAGGRAVKNVAGYDLTKFMVGQAGVFGRVVTITTRTYRKPAGAMLAVFDADIRCLNQLLPTALRPQWALLTAGELLCGYLGDERRLAWYTKALGALTQPRVVRADARTLDEDSRHRAALFCWPAGEDGFRASVPPMRIAKFAQLCGPLSWAADAAHGIVVGRCDGDVELERVREAVAAVMGTMIYGTVREVDGAGGGVVDRTADGACRSVTASILKRLHGGAV